MAGDDHLVRSERLDPVGGSDGGGPWQVETIGGGSQALHDLDVPAGRTVRVHLPERPAVVLGSSQSNEGVEVSLAAVGAELARRRSGGGAVWLAPGEQVWVDVVVPAGDPVWSDDVTRAGLWLGRCWIEALGSGGRGTGGRRGAGGFEVFEGPMERRRLGAVACFAGLASGEVVLAGPSGGVRKVVGVSQRRTRGWARFQCVAYLHWDPAPLLAALGPGVDGELADVLRHHAAAVPAAIGGTLVERLCAALP